MFLIYAYKVDAYMYTILQYLKIHFHPNHDLQAL